MNCRDQSTCRTERTCASFPFLLPPPRPKGVPAGSGWSPPGRGGLAACGGPGVSGPTHPLSPTAHQAHRKATMLSNIPALLLMMTSAHKSSHHPLMLTCADPSFGPCDRHPTRPPEPPPASRSHPPLEPHLRIIQSYQRHLRDLSFLSRIRYRLAYVRVRVLHPCERVEDGHFRHVERHQHQYRIILLSSHYWESCDRLGEPAGLPARHARTLVPQALELHPSRRRYSL